MMVPGRRAGMLGLWELLLVTDGEAAPAAGLGSGRRLAGNQVVHADSLGDCHIMAAAFSPFLSPNYICHITS